MKLKSRIAALILSVFSSWAGPSKKDQQELIAAVIWAEARGEGTIGLGAVAEVIRNRTGFECFGLTPYAVVTRKNQFACLNREKPRDLIARASGDSFRWELCLGYAQAILEKRFCWDVTNGATYFHAERAYPAWRRELTFTVKIGGHYFYK